MRAVRYPHCAKMVPIAAPQKEVNARRFGILPSCSHCFCVACIRQWRSSSQFETKVTRLDFRQWRVGMVGDMLSGRVH